MFELIGVRYGSILDLPNLEIREKQVTSLTGPSGSGKTSVLRMLNKMISPTSGQILFRGVDLREVDSVAHRRKVVMLSQEPAVFGKTIRDNLHAGLLFQEKKPSPDSALKEMMKKVGLEKSLDDDAHRLSGGERQRLALARVILLDPDVYLLDEPSSALDEETGQLIFDMLTTHAKANGKTIIMVTHSRAAAQKYSNVIIEMNGGKCMKKDSVHE